MRAIKQIVKKILLFVQVDWIDTFRLNLFHLPHEQGRKFPILLFKAKLHIAHGAFMELQVPQHECKFGMIKLGCQYSKNVIAPIGVQIDLRSNGGLIFKGSGIMGHGSNIITRRDGIISIGRTFAYLGIFRYAHILK